MRIGAQMSRYRFIGAGRVILSGVQNLFQLYLSLVLGNLLCELGQQQMFIS